MTLRLIVSVEYLVVGETRKDGVSSRKINHCREDNLLENIACSGAEGF